MGRSVIGVWEDEKHENRYVKQERKRRPSLGQSCWEHLKYGLPPKQKERKGRLQETGKKK